MKVVMVDENSADCSLCQELLGEVYGPDLQFYQSHGAAQGLETCRAVAPDCVLLNYTLPDSTGLEFLAQLRPKIPVVMLDFTVNDQAAVQALRAGAHDFLGKDNLSAERLSMAVRKASETAAAIRALQAERDLLARALAEKEVLLQEVHHRMKNNLAVIASLLRVQASKVSDEAGAALRESQHRVESMALIHEQLYAAGGERQVDLAFHASLLAARLFHSFGVDPDRISWNATLEPLAVSLDQAIPAGLILNELISNALKHAFPDGRGGSISITGGRVQGRIHLEVQDDGIGVPADLARPGSLGMQIVQILTRQLKGTFEVARGRPVQFKISFPEADSGQQIMQSAGGGR